MAATKWTLVLAMVASLAISGRAQQSESAKLGMDFPVPAWPANGVIPPDLKDHYVFVDLAKNEYVVAYPENLGSPDFEKNGPGNREVNRYKLQRDVDPKVLVSVSSVAGGKFKYTYALSNGTAAKQPIGQWLLVLPEAAAASSTVKKIPGWFGVIQKNRKFPVNNPQWIKTGTAIVFAYEKPQEQIQPGSDKGGFELESDLRPGFTLGYYRQAESTEAAVQESGNIPTLVVKNATPPPPPAGSPPPPGGGFGGAQTPPGAISAWQPIKDDVEKLLEFEYNSKTVLTLGPKFDKSATDSAIASDFAHSINVLSQTGVLNASSAFVKSTLAELDAYVKANGSGQLKLSGQPRGDAETEVFNALKLSLHLN